MERPDKAGEVDKIGSCWRIERAPAGVAKGKVAAGRRREAKREKQPGNIKQLWPEAGGFKIEDKRFRFGQQHVGGGEAPLDKTEWRAGNVLLRRGEERIGSQTFFGSEPETEKRNARTGDHIERILAPAQALTDRERVQRSEAVDSGGEKLVWRIEDESGEAAGVGLDSSTIDDGGKPGAVVEAGAFECLEHSDIVFGAFAIGGAADNKADSRRLTGLDDDDLFGRAREEAKGLDLDGSTRRKGEHRE